MDDILMNEIKQFSTKSEENDLTVVITDASTDVARAFAYKILYDKTFGEDQSICINLYDHPKRSFFLESVAIELTAFHPNLLKRINYSSDCSVSFVNTDVIVLIGNARGYTFTKEEFSDCFFLECVLAAKFYGEAIEKYAKSDVKIVTIGGTEATIVSRYAPSVPLKNITALSILDLHFAKNHTAHFWISRECLPQILHRFTNKSWHTRALAYALADHIKYLWTGTPETEWTCMSVASDNSYGIPRNQFFSFPVICKDKEYQIVKVSS
ncbi:malate dehydrogenase, cytoplasmic-like [Prorops nasuta]|uniref:malate dehydrogenase, cytoplasmic-like n=1 Tax=Prorops nasuta TaxID=863751 RepID=UPI0034CF0C81